MIKTGNVLVAEKLVKAGGVIVDVKGIKYGEMVMRKIYSINIDKNKVNGLLTADEMSLIEFSEETKQEETKQEETKPEIQKRGRPRKQ